MLSLGHLSTIIVTPEHLRDFLLKIQAKLPHQLRLPADPRGSLWYYYGSLDCVPLMDGDKLLILVSLPLLDKKAPLKYLQ